MTGWDRPDALCAWAQAVDGRIGDRLQRHAVGEGGIVKLIDSKSFLFCAPFQISFLSVYHTRFSEVSVNGCQSVVWYFLTLVSDTVRSSKGLGERVEELLLHARRGPLSFQVWPFCNIIRLWWENRSAYQAFLRHLSAPAIICLANFKSPFFLLFVLLFGCLEMGWNVEIWPVLYLLLRTFICRIAKEVWHGGIPVSLWDNTNEEEEKLIFLWGECISHRKNLLCEVLNWPNESYILLICNAGMEIANYLIR